MSEALQLLGGLTVKQFLNEYWQKKPLLIRNAFPDFQPPLSADELAGLACEEGVESRIILEKDGPSPWAVEHGPFIESRFSSLPKTHWTLLVQGVDSWVPEVAELIEPFRFLPDWRIDDIMISYAPKQGSVGPHLDQYDVFLIQAQGYRHWQVSTRKYNKDDCIPGISLSILNEFDTEQEWTLGPGDILYLPPNVAHYGVAQDDCMTYSVGFRAPAKSELLSSFIDDLLPQFSESQRYEDKNLAAQNNPGEISPQALKNIQQIIRLNNIHDNQINHWFGQYITEPKQPHETLEDNLSENEVVQLIKSSKLMRRDMHSRFAYIKDKTSCYLFINGEEYSCKCELAEYLCREKVYKSEQLLALMTEHTSNLIISLINQQLIITSYE